MKLYYTAGACSLAPHILLEETGEDYEAIAVDLAAKKLQDGSDYRAVNPKGAVPALEIADGEVLTENAVILQFIADRAGRDDLLPAGGLERYRVLEWMGYIATELHKGFGPLWSPTTPDDFRETTRDLIGRKFDFVQQQLTGDFLRGSRFTPADAYLYTILRWSDVHRIDLGRWPGLAAYRQRVAQRPAVQRALSAEGIGA
jgi:glutathione S-transferase